MMRTRVGASATAPALVARVVARVVVPVVCPGCGLPDVRWCGDCEAAWWEPPFRSESGAGRLDVLGQAPIPVWSVAPLTGPPQLMIAAWKDGARRDMDAFFGEVMARAAAHLSSALAPITIVVPVPARSSSTRRRGVDLPAVLARGASSGLVAPGRAGSGRAGPGRSASAVACLRNSGGESRRLGARGRWVSAAAGIRASSAPAGETALLVDDVLTTGASLARSCWALEREGVAVAAAITLAATPGRTRDFGPLG